MATHALVEWQEEGLPLGVISLKVIEYPRVNLEEYHVNQDVRARCRGYKGIHPAKILQIGGEQGMKEEISKSTKSKKAVNGTHAEQSQQKKKSKVQEKNDNVENNIDASLKKKQRYEERQLAATQRRVARKKQMAELSTRLDETLVSTLEESRDPRPENATEEESEEQVAPVLPPLDSSDEDERSYFELQPPLNEKGYATVAMKVPRKMQPCSTLSSATTTLDTTSNSLYATRPFRLDLIPVTTEPSPTSCTTSPPPVPKPSSILTFDRTTCATPIPACIGCTEKEKTISILKNELAEAYRQIENLKDSADENQLAIPKPGIHTKMVANKYKMVELVDGSGVYIYSHDIEEVQKVPHGVLRGSLQYGCRIAKLLVNKFWTKSQLLHATVYPSSPSGKTVLDQRIVNALIAFCIRHSSASAGKLRQSVANKLSSAAAKSKKHVKL